jgi:hypothetical protein
LKQLQNKAAVKCARRQTIPPNTVAFIKCKADTDDFTYSALLEPKVNLIGKGLLVQSSLCLTDREVLPVKVINLNDTPVKIHNGKVLGNIYPIDSQCDKPFRSVLLTEISDQVIQESQDKEDTPSNTRKVPKWSKDRLFQELRIHEISDVTDDELSEL